MTSLINSSRRLQKEQRTQAIMKQRVQVWWHENFCHNCAKNRAEMLQQVLGRLVPGETTPAFKGH